MFQSKGIRYKILFSSFLSIFIFSIFLIWVANIYWNVLLENKKKKLQNIVEVGTTLVYSYMAQEKSGTITRDEAQPWVKENFNAILYAGNEYLFVTNSAAYQVLNPVKPELSGKNMSEFKDPTGLKLYVEIANVAKKSGSGFVEYMFPKAGSSTPIKKLSYVYFFPEWDWIVGTGLYMDDVNADMSYFVSILLFGCIFAVISFIVLGVYFANSVVNPLSVVCQSLLSTSDNFQTKCDVLKESGGHVKKFSTEQASSIQTTAAAISEITSMIGKTTDLTGTSVKLANAITTKAENGEVSMKNMITSMKSIQEASAKLTEIEQIIVEIETKTQVINKIVSKTELLSLNASIEAARAGEHGKGFSVVAEEVGNLAHMSGKSSNEIRALVQKSREQVQKILHETMEKVKEGQSRTEQVSSTFSEIVQGIKEINFQMCQVSDATREQEIGVKQISSAMGMLDQLAFKNSLESENSLKVTVEISDESKKLKEISETTEHVVYGDRKKLWQFLL